MVIQRDARNQDIVYFSSVGVFKNEAAYGETRRVDTATNSRRDALSPVKLT